MESVAETRAIFLVVLAEVLLMSAGLVLSYDIGFDLGCDLVRPPITPPPFFLWTPRFKIIKS